MMLGLASLVTFTACKKNDSVNEIVQEQLKVDSTTLNLSGKLNDIDSFTIQFPRTWTITITPATSSWLKTTVSNGMGSTKIFVSNEENNVSNSPRSATLVITPSGDATKAVKVVVTQRVYTPVMTVLWSKLFGGTSDDYLQSVVKTEDGP